MKFRFSHFEFDCEALVLTNNGKVFSLNEKPAKLLALLLTNAEHIHSKDEILEAVWPGREVTNQVVFQSIGHLRALFGDDAIKTFSRKGYQWQLPLTEVTDDEVPSATSPQVETPKQAANNDNNEDLSIPSAPEDNIATDTPKPAWPLAAATLLGLLAGAYFFI
ncbi:MULTISPECIES: winged helix-turn-helix domain-containing protein [Pseudoalteromonas]|uniref:OmpR/PhoB-type domain-containing protein n=1 Tax=Pseudoalteromonas amylolytica TaxID=1859457 RepID=A0A1S1MNN2_9GAMM|nr:MULTISPECIES: winged helix-turn-helix domain-containing protein [Pseudoalteromonas]OHU85023.1 hypothetical protein BFC16_20265 [Pseudoalteromonas sp. JW3]OHU90026.1 hypothetical protein BET10_14710 [Pseudoalteromonas amylolytica]